VYQLLSDGSAIYLPVSLWYTPSGKLIRRNGIEPDITVELTIEDRAAGVDSQLTRAYDHLDDQLPEFR
jgi:C-terminal processing protease CtpA/Prc